MKKYLILLSLLFWVTLAQGKDNCFPAKEHVLLSPDHTHELIWKERQRDDEPHRLLYRVMAGSELIELLTFDREVCVYWSPDEKYFAISAAIGSNVTDSYIYKTDDTSQPIDVTDILPKKVAGYFQDGILHGYIDAVAWNNTGLIVRVFGDRESKPRHFDMTMRCGLENNKWTCTTIAAEPKGRPNL